MSSLKKTGLYVEFFSSFPKDCSTARVNHELTTLDSSKSKSQQNWAHAFSFSTCKAAKICVWVSTPDSFAGITKLLAFKNWSLHPMFASVVVCTQLIEKYNMQKVRKLHQYACQKLVILTIFASNFFR